MYDVDENVVKIPVFGDNGNREGFLKLGHLKEDRHGRKHLDYYPCFSTWQGKPLPRGLEILCRQEYETDSGKTFDYYLIFWHDPKGYSDEDCCNPLGPEKAIQWFQENRRDLPDDLKEQEIQNNQLQANHSLDFRSVRWFGTEHSFTATQAAIVKELWEARDNGTPDIGHAALLEKAKSESKRLVDVFKEHGTYKQLIGEGKTKGSYRLIDPTEKK